MTRTNEFYDRLYFFVKRYRYIVLPIAIVAVALIIETFAMELSSEQFKMFRYVGF